MCDRTLLRNPACVLPSKLMFEYIYTPGLSRDHCSPLFHSTMSDCLTTPPQKCTKNFASPRWLMSAGYWTLLHYLHSCTLMPPTVLHEGRSPLSRDSSFCCPVSDQAHPLWCTHVLVHTHYVLYRVYMYYCAL